MQRMRKMPAEKSASTDRSDSLLQSGPSLPTWKWRHAFAQISGPIGKYHLISIYYLPQLVERGFCLLRLILILCLAGFLARNVRPSIVDTIALFRSAAPAVTLLLGLLPISFARADYPDATKRQEQLEQRLENQLCDADQCASIDQIQINLEERLFVVEMQVRSEGVSAVSVPGPIADLVPTRVLLDGRDYVGQRVSGRFLQVKVPHGAHRVTVSGRIEPNSSVAVAIPQKPFSINSQSRGWSLVAPLLAGTTPDEIRFLRDAQSGRDKGDGDGQKGVVPTETMYLVTRMITIDERVSINGLVRRLGDLQRAS